MEFIPLEHQTQLDEIKNKKGYSVIFKHNTTCPISKAMRADFEAMADELQGVNEVYFLDLLEYRHLSDKIAETFNVQHQSPQVLLISDGQCTYHEALFDISAEATAKAMRS
jgi:bacillithiol system protein YtxJ